LTVQESSVALYDRHGRGYSRHRKPDPRIAAAIEHALGDAATVVNVGAGGGSYEPADSYVLAVEPSWAMRAERPPELPPAIDACAEALPLDDDSVDAALAILTLHHWGEQDRGLREMRRVARGPVVILTFDPQVKGRFWLWRDYVPETTHHDERVFPAPMEIVEKLGSGKIDAVPIPFDCTDAFGEAHWGRPEAYLDPCVRKAQSAWAQLPPGVEERGVRTLAHDLESGAWDERHGQLRRQESFDGGLRLVVSTR
jgi:SAM-dependent methyltransferase